MGRQLPPQSLSAHIPTGPNTPLPVDQNTQPPLTSAGTLRRLESRPRPWGRNPWRPRGHVMEQASPRPARGQCEGSPARSCEQPQSCPWHLGQAGKRSGWPQSHTHTLGLTAVSMRCQRTRVPGQPARREPQPQAGPGPTAPGSQAQGRPGRGRLGQGPKGRYSDKRREPWG